MSYGGRAKRGFGAQTPSNLAECEVFGKIGNRSIPGRGRITKEVIPERGLMCPLLQKERWRGEACMCEKEKVNRKDTWFFFIRGARCCGGPPR